MNTQRTIYQLISQIIRRWNHQRASRAAVLISDSLFPSWSLSRRNLERNKLKAINSSEIIDYCTATAACWFILFNKTSNIARNSKQTNLVVGRFSPEYFYFVLYNTNVNFFFISLLLRRLLFLLFHSKQFELLNKHISTKFRTRG